MRELTNDLKELQDIKRTVQGTYEPEDFIRVKAVINKHSYKAFSVVKEELLEQRLAHFKSGHGQKYADCIRQAS